MSEQRINYGSHPDQHVAAWEPAEGPGGLAVLVHGGYWRARHDASLLNPMARDLAERGWAVANVEYRRVGAGGGWPTVLDDVRAAIEAVTSLAPSNTPVVAVGHSAGGQLALLSGGRLDGVVALAPVTDVFRTYAEGLGENAAGELMGGPPDVDRPSYAAASPIRRIPVGRPALVVHGNDDDRVPLAHSVDYVAAAHEAGDTIELRAPRHLPHLDAIDPSREHWADVLSWMNAVRPRQVVRAR